MVSLCFPIFFHPDCTVGFGVSPNHALRLVGCTTGRESHPALKILDSISGSIIAWYITECKPFLKPGQNRDGTTFRRRTLSRGLAPSSSLSFGQSFHRVFLQAAESDVFSKVRVCEAQRKRELAAWQAEQAHHTTSKEKQSVPDGERPVSHIAVVCGFWQGASSRAHPVLFFQNCALIRAQRSSRFRVVAQQLFRTGPALRQGDRYFVRCQVAQH